MTGSADSGRAARFTGCPDPGTDSTHSGCCDYFQSVPEKQVFRGLNRRYSVFPAVKSHNNHYQWRRVPDRSRRSARAVLAGVRIEVGAGVAVVTQVVGVVEVLEGVNDAAGDLELAAPEVLRDGTGSPRTTRRDPGYCRRTGSRVAPFPSRCLSHARLPSPHSSATWVLNAWLKNPRSMTVHRHSDRPYG